MSDYVLSSNYINDLWNIYTKSEINTLISSVIWGTIDLWLYDTILNVNNKLLLYYKKTDFDINNYYNRDEINTFFWDSLILFDNYYNKNNINNLISLYYTQTQINNLLNTYYNQTQINTIISNLWNSNWYFEDDGYGVYRLKINNITTNIPVGYIDNYELTQFINNIINGNSGWIVNLTWPLIITPVWNLIRFNFWGFNFRFLVENNQFWITNSSETVYYFYISNTETNVRIPLNVNTTSNFFGTVTINNSILKSSYNNLISTSWQEYITKYH